jgi:N-acetylmuramoyl-L-alanine amidase
MVFRYVRQFAVHIASLAGVLLLTGCPTPPKTETHITHLAPIAQSAGIIPPLEAAREPALEPATVVSVQPQPALQPVLDRSESVLPEETLQLPAGMLPISTWAELCGYRSVRSIANSNPQAVELQSALGTLTLFLGQRFAKWNGVNLGLGYAPAARRGVFTLNSVDVLKNAYPLGLGHLSVPSPSRVLVIDPGHGGPDPGSRSAARNVYEKDLALDWALRIERQLANSPNSNWRVVLTRRDDRDVSLLDRVAMADQAGADIFISLHFNALEKNGSTPEETGVETYCLTPVGAPSNITRNFEDDLRKEYPNNAFDAQNLLLATRIQSNLVRASGRRDRGVRRARFMTVVREQKRPAVLVEGGFLSNPEEAGLIVQPSFRDRLAQAVCDALPD